MSGPLPRGKSDRGLLLIEIVLVLVILSVGLLYVLRSFSAALSASAQTERYTRALALMDRRLWDLAYDGARPPGQSDGVFPEDNDYSWREDVTRFDGLAELNRAEVRVAWDDARHLTVVTLIRNAIQQ